MEETRVRGKACKFAVMMLIVGALASLLVLYSVTQWATVGGWRRAGTHTVLVNWDTTVWPEPVNGRLRYVGKWPGRYAITATMTWPYTLPQPYDEEWQRIQCTIAKNGVILTDSVYSMNVHLGDAVGVTTWTNATELDYFELWASSMYLGGGWAAVRPDVFEVDRMCF